MILSMTGYGKAEAVLGNRKFKVEIRSLNGKNADISMKSSVLPRDKELELRQLIARTLVRGNIDAFVSEEQAAEASEPKQIDKELFLKYCAQLRSLSEEAGFQQMPESVFTAILHLPEVMKVEKEEFTEEAYAQVEAAMKEALEALVAFRKREGAVLEADLRQRVKTILETLEKVENFEGERVVAIREKMAARFAELNISPDPSRMEQEMIFYIEKLDVNEEKVRLRQHCSYFIDTIEKEDCPGKKLGFIAQEMGREINTLGSKSNNAMMQQYVVMMKDELEKIKEQVLNVL